MTRTQAEIDKMISKLKRIKTKIPETNFFGGNNWAVIDTQIDVLEDIIPDEEELYDMQDNGEIDEEQVSAGLDAIEWLNGSSDDLGGDIEDDYNPEEIATIIKVRTKDWAGNCYFIASLCLQHKVVEGKLCYGNWTGSISPASLFGGRGDVGFVHHGWVEMEDGRIFDPTRWAFGEQGIPYIYVGENDHYDVGGNQYRTDNRREPPVFKNDAKEKMVIKFNPTIRTFVKELLKDKRRTDEYSFDQLYWLSNLSMVEFGLHAKAIYIALDKGGMGACIPIDNWNYCVGKKHKS